MCKAYSTEQVSKWHPDKYADQISDTLLTAYLEQDPVSHCGIETMVKDDTVIVSGEVSSRASVSPGDVVKEVADKLHYKVSNFINLISQQSGEINNAVNADSKIGAGDQGIMFGYATRETDSMLPYGFDMANRIIASLERITLMGDYHILFGDAKTQVTTDENGRPKTIVISVCHSPYIDVEDVRRYIKTEVGFDVDFEGAKLLINPAGAWTYGGPYADCGLTGRKIVCDQYGGYCPVGGGAFSGKDPSKVDRSGSYMARKIAMDMIKKYEDVESIVIQLAYAIGVAEPVGIYVGGVSESIQKEIGADILRTYDLTPKGIIDHLGLYNRNYGKIAEGCHYRPDCGLFF